MDPGNKQVNKRKKQNKAKQAGIESSCMLKWSIKPKKIIQSDMGDLRTLWWVHNATAF